MIGRDHLDCGSVASPYRETESMKDGSDAVADWPLLNALLNTASGASWVSIHNGGGVGIGYSQHAGQVTVADGTDAMAKRIERVLTNDPGIGIVRHVDAGYDEAKNFAKNKGVKVPMGIVKSGALFSNPELCSEIPSGARDPYSLKNIQRRRVSSATLHLFRFTSHRAP